MKQFLLFLAFILTACTDCPRCPAQQSCPIADLTTHAEPVTQAPTEDAAPETTASAAPTPEAWEPVDPTTLVGKWRAANGEPLPTFEIVAGEPGSKTPMNFDVRDRAPAHIGCGLYPATGTSFCKTVEKVTDQPPATAEQLHADFAKSGDRIHLTLSGDGTPVSFGDFVRDGAK